MILDHRKNILRKIPNGLFIVTANDGDIPIGATVSFLTQVSLEPPLIALAIRKNSNLFAVATKTKNLAIHLPSKDQKDMVASFFKTKEQTTSSINGYKIEWSSLKNPLLIDIPMILEVKIIEIVNKGDHPVFICEILNTILKDDVEILSMTDTNWHYGG